MDISGSFNKSKITAPLSRRLQMIYKCAKEIGSVLSGWEPKRLLFDALTDAPTQQGLRAKQLNARNKKNKLIAEFDKAIDALNVVQRTTEEYLDSSFEMVAYRRKLKGFDDVRGRRKLSRYKEKVSKKKEKKEKKEMEEKENESIIRTARGWFVGDFIDLEAEEANEEDDEEDEEDEVNEKEGEEIPQSIPVSPVSKLTTSLENTKITDKS